ncbi:ATP-binding protein (plasmid) [Pseudomonas silesiensis]|uniref:ATP-binding protein n=1 Tax=Pseudomonas silesiensis TaxID=1853130 RepID=UPI0030D45A1B
MDISTANAIEQPEGHNAMVPVSADGQGVFKINRVFLIDSLAKGRITELVTDGGAVITGRNGRGKTSMLQFLPLFYGVSPSKLVSPGKDSFIEYYLPNSTSYIVFEYQRDDGSLRLVVAYSNSTSDKVFYRFVRSGYDKKMFVLDNDELVKNRDFRARLSELGVECSQHQIENYADYKAVIQFSRPSSSDRKQQDYLKRLSADYAFTRYNTPLTHVDKIVLGMFSRKANFEVLQSIVVDCVSEDTGSDSSHSIRSDRRKIEEWPRHYRAYTEVMRMQPVMLKASEERASYDQVRETLSSVKAKLQLLAGHLASEESKARDIATSSREARDAGALQNTQDRNEIEKSRVGAAHEVKVLTEKVTALTELYEQYQADDIASKIVRVDNAQQLKSDLETIESRLVALEGSFLAIGASYELIKANLAGELEGDRVRLRAEIDSITQQCEELIAKADKHYEEQEAKAEAQALEKHLSLKASVQAASIELGTARQNSARPQADADVILRVSTKDEEVTTLRRIRDETHEKNRVATQALERVRKDDEAADAAIIKHIKKIGEQEALIENIQLAHTPKEGTLLHLLRNQLPEWKHDIAKVLREDLLQRTDLNPELVENAQSIFGLRLDLDVLQPTELADESLVLTQIEEARDVLAGLIAGKKKCEDDKAAIAVSLKAATKAENDAGKARLEAVSKVQVAETELAALKFDLKKSLAEAQSLADAALVKAQGNLDTVNDELTQFQAHLAQEKALRRNALSQARARAVTDRDSGKTRIDTTLKNREISHANAIKECNKEKDEALRKEGADVDKINQLRTEQERIKAELQLSRDAWQVVTQYKSWIKNEYPLREGYDLQAKAKAAEVEELKTKIAELDGAWKLKSEALNEAATAADQKVATLTKESGHVTLGLERLVNVKEAQIEAYDHTWTTDAVLSVLTESLETEKAQLKKINGLVQKIRKGFTDQINTPPYDYIQEASNRVTSDTPLGWLDVCKEWFEVRHSDMKQILMVEVRTITAEIELFHRKLSTFSNRISHFNRELQKYLDNSTCFESISGLAVHIISTVDELKYWPTVKRLVDARRDWSVASNDLPDMEFVQMLEGLLEHWEMKNGIGADFKSLVQIRGEVVENGNTRKFKDSSELDNVSSNGLSYLVLVIIFIAFLNRIRRNVPINLLWSLDELKAIDSANIHGLGKLLSQNNITLVSAFPDPDAETLMLFKNAYSIDADRRLVTTVVSSNEFDLNEVEANV